MAELKTKKNKASVTEFLNAIGDEQQRVDAKKIVSIMEEVTGEKPDMWGSSIVGFGSYHYKYASGREADWMLVGFSPRKQNLTLYIMSGFEEYDQGQKMQKYLDKLGKHSTGKSCLYIKKLSDVNEQVLREMIAESVAYMKKTNG